MGECFIAVNPTKRQYVSHNRLPFNSTFGGLLSGVQGLAVGLLACDISADQRVHPLMGTWARDPVIVAGDDFGEPDTGGFSTTTNDDKIRNMHWMARDSFEDITFPAIAMLCAFDANMADHFALLINRHRRQNVDKPDLELLSVLMELAETMQCHQLREALQRAAGSARDSEQEWNERTVATPEFVVVNTPRREYLDPDRIRVRTRNFRILEGAARLLQGPTAHALGLAITDTSMKHRGLEGDFYRTWLGDPLVVAFKESPPNPSGFATTTGDSPHRNLYYMAQEEFEDLSGLAMAALLRSRTWVADQPRLRAPLSRS
jgi:hypothetical protein